MDGSNDTGRLRDRLAELERCVAERGRDGARLERQTRFLYNVIESLNHPFYVVDARDYTIKLANSAAKFGDLVDKPTCYALTHNRDEPCDGGDHKCPLQIVKATRRPVTVEHVHYDQEGRPRNIEVHAHPVMDSHGNVVQMIEYCLDITERRRAEQTHELLEARLRQTQKLEAIGTLAGGVAHDMNNTLAVIMGGASILTRNDVAEHTRREVTDRILDAAHSGAALTRNLLGFARRGKHVKEPVDLGRIVKLVTELLSRTIPKQVALRPRMDPALAPIEGDANQLSQALMNLCLNGAQAMSDGGPLTVLAGNVELDQATCEGLPGMSPGPYVQVQVIDEGVGMSNDTLERAFEPFFTTKQPGEGTGLGLSMAYGTIRNHGGILQLTSTPGRGTTATVLIPVAASRAVPCRRTAEPSPPAKPTGGTILLVDDEELFRYIAGDLLESLGYVVLRAEHGEAAVRIYEQYDGPIDLVILDLAMPGMGGLACFERLRRLDTAARVLVCSGFAQDDTVSKVLNRGAVGFLPKPFDAHRLTATVAQALSKPRARPTRPGFSIDR
ncbi:MAG: response regulator [Deltaproteobacteria bacterium]|nr:response regulator [Deltaproteobacteria bacterium]